jgi:hypothetical protein
MATVTKQQLKKIVKECLLEILSEGLGSSLGSNLEDSELQESFQPNKNRLASNSQHSPSQSLRPALSTISYGKKQPIANESIKTITKDPLMAAILADTAKTTLVEQDSSRASQPSIDHASHIVAEADPVDLFGEEAQMKWNALAFSPAKKILR